MMKSVGIDIGTTSISASVFDTEQPAQGESCNVSNGNFIRGEDWERLQDPASIVSKAKQLLDAQLEKHPDICAIGLTGQMHGILYVNKDGKHVSPLYTWQDERGNRELPGGKSACEILQQEYGRKIYTGYGFATHVYQIQCGLVPEEAASFCSAADYFGMILTEKKKPVIHSSMASSMGIYDVMKQTVDVPLLKAFDLAESSYPDVTSDFVSVGCYQGLPVCVAIGDNQASFLGSVESPQNTVLLNIGTGGQVSVLSEIPYQAENIEARPVCRDLFLLAGSSLCGGRAYALLKDFFQSYAEAMGITEADHYSIMNHILENSRPENKLKVKTLFAGTRENPQLRGSIENIGTDNFTPAALIDGVLEGMTDELYQLCLQMKSCTGRQYNILKASGNGIRKNKWLQQKAAEHFNLPLSLTAYEEEAARGAAKTALAAASLLTPANLFGI